jgi:hypothetical protein
VRAQESLTLIERLAPDQRIGVAERIDETFLVSATAADRGCGGVFGEQLSDPERVSGRPWRVANSGSSGWPWRSLSHWRRTATVSRVRLALRRLRFMPRTWR